MSGSDGDWVRSEERHVFDLLALYAQVSSFLEFKTVFCSDSSVGLGCMKKRHVTISRDILVPYNLDSRV